MWNLLPKLMACIHHQLNLQTVDHRTWHCGSVVVNEIFCKDRKLSTSSMINEADMGLRMIEIQEAIEESLTLSQHSSETCRVSVVRWFGPGGDGKGSSHASSRRHARMKTRSAPVGGALFQENDTFDDARLSRHHHPARLTILRDTDEDGADDTTYDVHVSEAMIEALRAGRGSPVVVHPKPRVLSCLGGFVRPAPTTTQD